MISKTNLSQVSDIENRLKPVVIQDNADFAGKSQDELAQIKLVSLQ